LGARGEPEHTIEVVERRGRGPDLGPGDRLWRRLLLEAAADLREREMLLLKRLDGLEVAQVHLGIRRRGAGP
jgi:hypothetical protein